MDEKKPGKNVHLEMRNLCKQIQSLKTEDRKAEDRTQKKIEQEG